MANWDFTVDSEKQIEVSNSLYEAADNFDGKVSLLYGQIDSMENTSWIGEDYTAFKDGTHGYEGALKDLSDGFRMFGKHFEIMSEGTNNLATELIEIVHNMTGNASGATSGEDVPVVPSDSYYDGDYNNDGFTPGGSTDGSGAGRSDVPGDGGSESGGSGYTPENINPDPVPGPSPEDGNTNTHQSESGATHGGGGRRSFDTSDNSSQTPEAPSPIERTTYNRGESLNVGDNQYYVYGTYNGENNSVVLYTDGDNRLYYQAEDGTMNKVETNIGGRYATTSNLGEELRLPVDNHKWDEKTLYWKIGDELVKDTNMITSTATIDSDLLSTQPQTPEVPSPIEYTTYNRGESLNVGDNQYYVYGTYDGENNSVVLYTDADNRLYYQTEDGTMNKVETNIGGRYATTSNLGEELRLPVDNHKWDEKTLYWEIDGELVKDASVIKQTATIANQ